MRALSAWLIILILVLLSCADHRDNRTSAIKTADTFIEVTNEAQPEPPFLDIEFTEDLVIPQGAGWPTQLFIDNQANIHVFLGKEHLLRRYDRSGEKNLEKVLPKGQAPGEFKFFDPCFSRDGRLFVVDESQRRLTIMDRGLENPNISKLEFWGGVFRLDSKNRMHFITMEFLPNTTDRQRLILSKYTPEGRPLLKIHEYEWGDRQDSSGIYHTNPYRSQLRYKIDSQDNVHYMMTDRYEINQISTNGLLIRTIIKKGKPRKLTQEEIDGFKPNRPNARSVTDLPERVPPIADLFLLDDGSLLVITFESLPGGRPA
jgi:hypothetical protein